MPRTNAAQGVPQDGFGIADRPGDLLHLVTNALGG